MATELKPKIKEFALKYLDNKQNNGTQVAKEVFRIKDANYAGVKSSRLLRNDRVREFMEDKAEPIAKNMVKLALKARNEQVQVAAGKDVLDRAGYKPVEKSQSVNVNIDVDNMEELRILAEKVSNQIKKGYA